MESSQVTRTAGLILIAGGLAALALHSLEAPEELYRWLYHQLLGGLDVPEQPSDGTVLAVSLTSLVGSFAQLAAGAALLALAHRGEGAEAG